MDGLAVTPTTPVPKLLQYVKAPSFLFPDYGTVGEMQEAGEREIESILNDADADGGAAYGQDILFLVFGGGSDDPKDFTVAPDTTLMDISAYYRLSAWDKQFLSVGFESVADMRTQGESAVRMLVLERCRNMPPICRAEFMKAVFGAGAAQRDKAAAAQDATGPKPLSLRQQTRAPAPADAGPKPLSLRQQCAPALGSLSEEDDLGGTSSGKPTVVALEDLNGEPTASASSTAPVARTLGLQNVGNTCFMNSAMQALANIEQIARFFLSEKYKSAINVHGRTTADTEGKLAEAFAHLVNTMWSAPSNASRWGVDPEPFRSVVVKMADIFSYGQQDLMEFLEYLVDGLKEDCNMIKGKKLFIERRDQDGRPDAEVALEAATRHLMQSDSFLDDQFAGLMKTMSRCPDCGHESATFDPFLSVKLPLQNEKAEFVILVAPWPSAERPAGVTQHMVSVSRASTIQVLIQLVCRDAGLDLATHRLFEVADGTVFREFDAEESVMEAHACVNSLVLQEVPDAENFAQTADRSWCIATDLHPGDVVMAKRNFLSNNTTEHRIRIGTHGIVELIDEDGDAKISFDNIRIGQFVTRQNFHYLKRDISRDSKKRKRDEDNQLYTLEDLLRNRSQTDTVELLRSRWRHIMMPESDTSLASATCGVTLYFRRPEAKSAGFTMEVDELIGTPLMFCVPRAMSLASLRSAVQERLYSCFGIDDTSHPNECELFLASSADDASTTQVSLGVETAAGTPVDRARTETREWRKEREHVVVHFAASVPERLLAWMAGLKDSNMEGAETRPSLDTCFGWLTQEEQLSTENKIECPGCKQKSCAFRKSDFWSLPPVLAIQLKRFSYDNMQRVKLNIPVEYPVEGLDMSKFCSSTTATFPSSCLRAGSQVQIHGLQSESGKKLNGQIGTAVYLDTKTEPQRFCVRMYPEQPSEEWKKLRIENLKVVGSSCEMDSQACNKASPWIYDLAAVCKHTGSAHFGHYVAYAKSYIDHQWRLYNDERVTVVTAAEVQQQCDGAYVLFYVQRSAANASCESAVGGA
mmetsp:Transcript_1383/g.3737  ORF Transcript_1383/g.3737 Transcript_1383/m.3737 type:complete len:1038 (-) Transcript_1383:168-3281(-)